LQPLSYDEGGVDCWRCGGTGWRKSERKSLRQPAMGGDIPGLAEEVRHQGLDVIRGTDPAILCPECEE